MIDPYGLESWSSHTGSSGHATALQMAAMLAGVAGPVVELDHDDVSRPMSPLLPVLVTNGGGRPRALEVLRSTPLEMDSRLRQRFAAWTAEEIHEAADKLRGSRSQFIEATEANRFAQVCGILKESDGMGGPDPYHSDWEPDAYDRRLRTVLRPRFILECPPISKMEELVASCHDSMALLPGLPLELLLRGGDRAFELFFGLVAGRDLDLPVRVTGKSLATSERGQVRCILTATHAEIADAIEAFPIFANRVVLVRGDRPAVVGPRDERSMAIFEHVFSRQIQLAADKRRRGHSFEFRPWSPEGRHAYREVQLRFLDACDAAKVPCTGLEDLPAIMRWTFSLIARSDTPPHEEVAEIIHQLCNGLLRDHVHLLSAAQQRSARARQLALAEKLVGRVSAKQPVRQRDLIRTFDNQKVERYRPVLDLLVELGVLVEEPRNVFRLGAQQLDSVRSRWLSDSMLLS
ncbi:hypothetical protein [Luteolibacter marinus]|uniref:hypothetical protein n=1 Tax=Luteolibacter marinus TaxID=2776705 RepID=UPI001868D069|nr:hypothetical protein [Luteolibacter marinus]